MKTNKPEHSTQNSVSFNQKRTELHQKELGLEIPNDYFKTSKEAILSKTTRKTQRTRVLTFVVSAAAMVLLAWGLNSVTTESSVPTFAMNDEESKMLVNSLFMNENKLEELSDSYMLEDLYEENEVLN
ncbi:hypothetical protein [Ochrovirga pacifica]|uniref:hypothetical protein n=1 Tax=Ochrovirga pacifica TaxID=1042376 RepID=UPI0002559B36|nr:hypothetical protein [Ochrovirga pacifica]